MRHKGGVETRLENFHDTIGSLPVAGSLLVAAIWLLGTGACGLELYNQVRSGRKPLAPGVTTPGASSSTELGAAS